MDFIKEYLNKPDFGLFLLRLIVGVLIIAHGVNLFIEGDFKSTGANMSLLGIQFGFMFWGFMAALVQTVCGFFVIIGFLFRLSCFLLFFTMVVATVYHFNADHDLLNITSHAIKTGAVFAALLFTGPGTWVINGDD